MAECERTGAVVVGVRPVTDTVKHRADGSTRLGETVDRAGLICVTSPVVLPGHGGGGARRPRHRPTWPGWWPSSRGRFPVRHLEAPALGRRVAAPGDLDVLVALSSAQS